MKEKLKKHLKPYIHLILFCGGIALMLSESLVVHFYSKHSDNILAIFLYGAFVVLCSICAIVYFFFYASHIVLICSFFLYKIAKIITLKHSLIFISVYFFIIFLFQSCLKIMNRPDRPVSFAWIGFPFFTLSGLYLLKILINMYKNYQINKKNEGYKEPDNRKKGEDKPPMNRAIVSENRAIVSEKEKLEWARGILDTIILLAESTILRSKRCYYEDWSAFLEGFIRQTGLSKVISQSEIKKLVEKEWNRLPYNREEDE